ncbi:MAG: glycosyltransferase [Gammaproteobacteria bacterium]|nr:glycosyltransferase [Gammaproteobacteria bacterium]
MSINCLSRALTLAEMLAVDETVQIIGFSRKGEIWLPARSSKIPIKDLPYGGPYHWLLARQELRKLVINSRIIVCKPRLTSMGLALFAGCDPARVILDINDWELGIAINTNRIDGHFDRLDMVHNLMSPNSPLLCRIFESKIPQFSNRIVNNRWLQQRFGGQLIYDVRDTDRFDPAKFDRKSIRSKLNLGDRFWVIFSGTPHPHKGIVDLVSALNKINGPMAPGLMLCGGGSSYTNKLIKATAAELGNARFRFFKQYNRLDAPYYLAAADIACIPSGLTSVSVGQVPTKLFEAMAMGLPIITTQVCDMPDLVSGIGNTVPPENPDALAEAIVSLSRQPDLCRQLGEMARKRAVNEFSYHSTRPVLRAVMSSISE